jgi:hypothetical protein
VELGIEFATQLQAFQTGIVDTIPFDGRYAPDEGELLVIEEFEDVDGLVDAVNNPLAFDQFDPQIHSLDSVKALFAALDGNANQILIQYFERRRLVAKGFTIFYSGDTFQKMTDAGLALDTKLLAVLEGSDLKFQSFHFLRRVFDLSEYFNEATDEEITSFANHEKLHVEDVAAFIASAGPLVRKKISLIQQSGVLNSVTTEQIVASAQEFNIDVQTNAEGNIVVPSNKTELRRLLRFLDEDYYASPLSQTRYVSNSKRVAD